MSIVDDWKTDLGHKVRAFDVDIECPVKILWLSARKIFVSDQKTSVEDQNVNVLEAADSLAEELWVITHVTNVCLDGNGVCSKLFNLAHNAFGCGGVASIVDDNGGTFASES